MTNLAVWMNIIINEISGINKEFLTKYCFSPTYKDGIVTSWMLREVTICRKCNMNEYHPTSIIYDKKKLKGIRQSKIVSSTFKNLTKSLRNIEVSHDHEMTWIENV